MYRLRPKYWSKNKVLVYATIDRSCDYVCKRFTSFVCNNCNVMTVENLGTKFVDFKKRSVLTTVEILDKAKVDVIDRCQFESHPSS